jgi:nucleoside-diphosphate-sugar epimerase
MNTKDDLTGYSGKRILITGGLGFIGSNLAHLLIANGATVTILDNLAPLYGGNLFNIDDIKNDVKVVIGDIRDKKTVDELVKHSDIIFDLAAQVSPIDSSLMPFEDLDINCRGHLNVLEACREHNPQAKVLFSSSRLALGKITQNPVTEEHPTDPLNMYGIHKLTAEKYFRMYHVNHNIRTVVFRITNPYGERQQIKHSKYSIPGWFMRLAMENKPIKIFGEGTQMRDYIHISDLVRAFALAGLSPKTDGNIYNCGTGKSVELKKMVETIVATIGTGSIEHVKWPENYGKEETGSFESDISKLQDAISWEPKVKLDDGVRMMCEYYKKNKDRYITSN